MLSQADGRVNFCYSGENISKFKLERTWTHSVSLGVSGDFNKILEGKPGKVQKLDNTILVETLPCFFFIFTQKFYFIWKSRWPVPHWPSRRSLADSFLGPLFINFFPPKFWLKLTVASYAITFLHLPSLTCVWSLAAGAHFIFWFLFLLLTFIQDIQSFGTLLPQLYFCPKNFMALLLLANISVRNNMTKFREASPGETLIWGESFECCNIYAIRDRRMCVKVYVFGCRVVGTPRPTALGLQSRMLEGLRQTGHGELPPTFRWL